jgi:hypothetical protein
MKLYDLLQLSVCVFSVLAAGFWLQAATNKFPKLANNLRGNDAGPFPTTLISQSRWNAAAAACAGVAAFSQSLTVLLPYASG